LDEKQKCEELDPTSTEPKAVNLGMFAGLAKKRMEKEA